MLKIAIICFRFCVRGVNDDGHVANFVETEQLITLDESRVACLVRRVDYYVVGAGIDMSTINLFVFLHNKQQTKVCPINYCNKQ